LVIAIAGAIKTIDARVIQWPQTDIADQVWRLVKVSRPAKK
jgi:hypothetical protein